MEKKEKGKNMQETIKKKKEKKRIEWIDVCKAFGIILMIIGHTVPHDLPVRNVIYSFHMPMFFILSGLTMKICNDWEYIRKKTIRDFKMLVIPAVLTSAAVSVLRLMTGGQSMTYDAAVSSAKKLAESLFWALGWDNKYPYIGAVWFLITMFWARLFVRIIAKLTSEERDKAGFVSYIFLFCSGIYAVCAGNQVILPQNMAVVPVAVMLVGLGMLAKTHMEDIRHMRIPLLVICSAFWLFCLKKDISIEMAVQSYPKGMICTINACAGTYLCACLSMAVCRISAVKEAFSLIGRHTLIILVIHEFTFLLNRTHNFAYTTENAFFNSFTRLTVIFFCFSLIMLVKAGKAAKLGKREKSD